MGAAVTLGRYRLLRCLGRGGMGVVHLALAQGPAGFEKLVALKVLDPKFKSDPRRAEGLLREALVGGRLDHEHLVQVLDLGHEIDQYFIAMEYVRGFSLSHALAHLRETGRSLPLFLAVRVVRAVTDAVVYMHGLTQSGGGPLGLVHGDISPSNVLLAADGRVKLSDLGVVALSGEHRAQVAGKLAYFPPEAFRGQPRTQPWDVFALGCVLYEVLTGERAFAGASFTEAAAAIEVDPPPVTDRRPDCPPALTEVVTRALARDPRERIRRADELAEALDAAYPEQPGDRERHRSFLSALYAEPDFVTQHGELPSETGVPSDMVPVFADEETEQVTVRGLKGTRPLRLALSPAHGSDRARRHGDRLAAELSRRLGRGLRTVVLADYESLTEALVAGDVDAAWMPPVPLVNALDRGAGVLAVARRAGATSYRAALVARAGTSAARAAGAPAGPGGRALADFAGCAIACVDRQSASGYVFPMAALVEALGLAGAAALTIHVHGSHRAVCEAVANGWVEAGATYAVLDEEGAVRSSSWQDLMPQRAGELEAAWLSGPIPGDCLAHRPHLPERTIGELRAALVGLAGEPDGASLVRDVFGAEALVPGEPDSYEPVRAARDAVRALGD